MPIPLVAAAAVIIKTVIIGAVVGIPLTRNALRPIAQAQLQKEAKAKFGDVECDIIDVGSVLLPRELSQEFEDSGWSQRLAVGQQLYRHAMGGS